MMMNHSFLRVPGTGVTGTVRVWSLEDGTLVHALEGHTRAVKSVCVTPDGKRVVTAMSAARFDNGTDAALVVRLRGRTPRPTA